jgi:glycosyltransferase involved in cell wall biosynthesis
MKTILHMIETGGTGGAETVYVDIVRGLDPQRWRSVALLPTREWMYDQLLHVGVQPILLRERRSFDFAFFARLLSIVRRQRVDLIHAHLFGSAVRAALVSRVCGIPALATLHGTLDLQPTERFRRLKIAVVNNGLDRIVFVSPLLRDALVGPASLRPELATVITNGIDARGFANADGRPFRVEFGIRSDEFVVGTIATPGRPAKGMDVLLDTAAILKKISPGCRFVVVGDLEFGRGIEMVADRDRRGLTRDVVMTGFREDTAAALAAFDVYALTSRNEGFPLSLLQAMAAARPIVATRCGGPEQILDADVSGILVQNGSAEAIARAIAGLRANREQRERLGAAAQAAVTERFTLDAQVRAYERVYEECIAQTRAKPVRNFADKVAPAGQRSA